MMGYFAMFRSKLLEIFLDKSILFDISFSPNQEILVETAKSSPSFWSVFYALSIGCIHFGPLEFRFFCHEGFDCSPERSKSLSGQKMPFWPICGNLRFCLRNSRPFWVIWRIMTKFHLFLKNRRWNAPFDAKELYYYRTYTHFFL